MEVNNMVTFIAQMIIRQAQKSIESGKTKYRAYFVKTRLYLAYKEDVDTILITDGYEECIVSE